MAISVLIFTAFSIYVVLKNYRNSYVRWLFIITVSLSVTILGLLVYISKYVNYYGKFNETIKNNLILLTDYQIWVRLFKINIGANNLTRLINISCAIFIYSVIGFSIVYCSKKLTRNKIVQIILLSILPLELIVFYDPLLSFKLFILVQNSSSNFTSLQIILGFIRGLHYFNYIWINIYFFLALLNIIITYKKARIVIKRNQILFVLTELIPVSVIFLFIFTWVPEKEVDIYSYMVRLSFIPSNFRIPYYYFDFMPVIVAVFIAINAYIIARYQILNTLEKSRQDLLKKSMKFANQNAKVVFHTFKIYFFAIKILSNKIQNEDCSSSSVIAAQITSMCEEYMDRINLLHNRLQDIDLEPKMANLVELVQNIISSLAVPENIEVSFNYNRNKVYAYIDEYHFNEAVSNIIINAIEAVTASLATSGNVTVALNVEDEWGTIQIFDNGPGIRKEDLKHIFKPFFTTKNTKRNWGVGLSYAQTVITAHGGVIDVKSSQGIGTEFEITIPVEREVPV